MSWRLPVNDVLAAVTYQYVTATLDLALPADKHNLLVCNDQGELLTTGRLPTPAS